MSKILITGGAGLVGNAVVDIVKKYPHEILVTDSLLYQDEYLRDIPFRGGDVSDEVFMKQLLKDFAPDAVIHLAGIVGDAACALRPPAAFAANIISVEILKKYYNGRIIFPSSCSVYGANDAIIDETATLNPLSTYAQMKIAAENLLKDKNAIIFRLGTLHGFTQRIRNDLVVNLLTIRALTSGEITVFGGEQYRPLLHVRDLATTIVYQLSLNYTGIYNLAEENYTILRVAEIVKEILENYYDKDIKLTVTELPFEDKRNYKVSTQKAIEDFGFHPTLGIDDTVHEIAQIYNEKRVNDYSNIRYSNVSALKNLRPGGIV